MEIKLLKTFVTIARLKNFSAAARELNTAQPAVSRQIAELEQEFKTKLFWRTTREVSLTTAGEALLVEALEILDKASRTELIVRRASEGKTGRLRIGYLSGATLTFLPKLIRNYVERYPDIQIQLADMTALEQIEAFEANQIDISLSRPLPPEYSKRYSSDLIYDDELAAFLPSSHPLANRSSISLRELKAESFVIFQRSHATGLFDQIIIACKKSGFSPQIVIQPGTMQTVLTEVASELGVSLAPGCIRNLNMTGCVCIPIRESLNPIPLQLHRITAPESPTVKAFVSLALNSRKVIVDQMALPKKSD